MESGPDSEVQKDDVSSDNCDLIYSLDARRNAQEVEWTCFGMWCAPALPFTYQIFHNVMLKVIITFGIKRMKTQAAVLTEW